MTEAIERRSFSSTDMRPVQNWSRAPGRTGGPLSQNQSVMLLCQMCVSQAIGTVALHMQASPAMIAGAKNATQVNKESQKQWTYLKRRGLEDELCHWLQLDQLGFRNQDGLPQGGQVMKPDGESTPISNRSRPLDLSNQQEDPHVILWGTAKTWKGSKDSPWPGDPESSSSATARWPAWSAARHSPETRGAEYYSSDVPQESSQRFLVVEEVSDERLRQLREETLREAAADQGTNRPIVDLDAASCCPGALSKSAVSGAAASFTPSSQTHQSCQCADLSCKIKKLQNHWDNLIAWEGEGVLMFKLPIQKLIPTYVVGPHVIVCWIVSA